MKSIMGLNTFSIDVSADNVVTAHTEKELLKLWKQASDGNRPVMVVGCGSNILFLENFFGTVLLNRIKGISITQDTDSWYLHVGAGELWHDLVTYSLDLGMPGV